MGRPTGNTKPQIRALGRGSEYFGPCERCGKKASEMFKFDTLAEWKRENGELYYFPIDAGTYAHESCQPAA